ncbi:MAG TPA: DedA family protein [Thermoanaerobaculia bacterium]|nr:DedA family protein [Thermoanaerobaculia bacterium]
MAQWIMRMMYAAGNPAIALLMFIENVFPPIPSELIMPLAGYMVSQGRLTLPGVIVAGTIGSVLGALPLYYAGRKVGEKRLKELADRHGRWVTVSGDEIEKAKRWFDRHGGMAVFFCRLVPGVRSLISIPAGIAEMNLVGFLAYTTVGSALWVALLAYLGHLLGANFKQVDKYLDPASWVVLGGLVVMYVWRVVRHGKGGQLTPPANSRDAVSHTPARGASARRGR